MVNKNLHLATNGVAASTRTVLGGFRFIADVCDCSARLSCYQLPNGGLSGSTPPASSDLGQSDRIRKPVSYPRDGSDRNEGKFQDSLGLADDAEPLHLAHGSAQFWLRHNPPSRHPDQFDHSARRALSARFPRFDHPDAALYGRYRSLAACISVSLSP